MKFKNISKLKSFLILGDISLLPNRPRDDQVNFLNACDVSIVS